MSSATTLVKFYAISASTGVGGYLIYKSFFSSCKWRKSLCLLFETEFSEWCFFFQAQTTREQYYKDAIDLLKGYEPAVKNLGHPIKPKTFKENDSFNEITNTKVKVCLELFFSCFFLYIYLSLNEFVFLYLKIKIPVEGSNKEADLFVFASRAQNEAKYVCF